MKIKNPEGLKKCVADTMKNVRVTDIHTHLYSPCFGKLLLYGIDELITYHYLVAETFRYVNMPYEKFWNIPKKEQADLIWKTLFIDRSPVSESCRGVISVLNALGLDTGRRNLDSYRQYFSRIGLDEYIALVFGLAGIDHVIMTNDPFDEAERNIWLNNYIEDKRFRAALRLDGLLDSWDKNCAVLQRFGYEVQPDLSNKSIKEVKRFLIEWIDRTGAVYAAASFSPAFRFPEDSIRGRLIEDCLLPICEEKNVPFALMIGVRKLVNPGLQLAGDAVMKADISAVDNLCNMYPRNKFMVTMLSRENQHELCVTARKFGNLMVFGCWWFLNNPSLIDEITRMRIELLGLCFIPQHSDARVFEQLLYKWDHSRKIIEGVLVDKYTDLMNTGWILDSPEVKRDIEMLFGGNFRRFTGNMIG